MKRLAGLSMWATGMTAALVFSLSPAASANVPAGPFTSWSAPTRIVTGGFNDRVSVAVDADGHTYVAAARQGDLWFATDRTGTWVAERVLIGHQSAFWGEPSIALDEQDRVHIIVVKESPDALTGDGIWYLTDKGHARGTFPAAPTEIAPLGSDEPTLKVSGGHLFVADVNGACCGHDGTVELRTNVTGRWTVATIGTGDEPAFALGTDDLSQVVYSRFGTKPGIFYAKSATVAGGFTHSRVSGTGSTDFVPLIALDESNFPSVAWEHIHGFRFDLMAAQDGVGGWQPSSTAALALKSGTSIDFDLDSLGRPMLAYGLKSVTVALLKNGTWRLATVAAATHVYALAIRGVPGGHAIVAWTWDESPDEGLWISSR
jgi:hypothetical protein